MIAEYTIFLKYLISLDLFEGIVLIHKAELSLGKTRIITLYWRDWEQNVKLSFLLEMNLPNFLSARNWLSCSTNVGFFCLVLPRGRGKWPNMGDEKHREETAICRDT